MNEMADILIVDDDRAISTTLSDILELKGYRTKTVTTGQDALVELKKGDNGVAILDLNLPDMEGITVLRELKLLSPFTEAIILTGHASLVTAIESVQHDAFAYMVKPVDPEQLLMMIKRAEEKRKLGFENRMLIEQLKAANEELEEKVAERTHELEAAYKNLRELDRLKSAFIDVTSHELRTPLSIVDATLSIVEKAINDEHRNLIKTLRLGSNASERLKKLVTRISEVSQIEKLAADIEKVKVFPGELIWRVVQDVSSFVEMRNQKVSMKVEDSLPAVVIDPNKIKDVLYNLLMNAIKFSPDGSEIKVEAYKCTQDELKVRVIDRGVGISEEDKPYVFDEFFTSFETMQHSSGEYQYMKRGIGLGLAIVKKFVAMHGGEVGVESEQGKGSTFWFTLPY